MNNKTLFIIFIALVGVFVLSKLLSGNKQSTFDPNIIAVDTSAVTQIVLTPKAEGGKQITLSKSNGQWQAEMDGLRVKTPANKVSGILGQMQQIIAKRVVSNSADKWAEYEVDEQGSGLKVMAGSKVVADFIVGTFKFDQVQRSASSYVRLNGEDEVYLVDGFISMSFNQGFDAFRNNQVVKLNREDLRQLTLTTNGESFGVLFDEADGHWHFAGMEQLDSTQMAQYVNTLTNTMGSDYIDGFAPPGAPVKSLSLNGNNMLAPVEVRLYPSQDKAKPFVVHSSQNPETWFLSDSTGVYERVFGKLETILTER